MGLSGWQSSLSSSGQTQAPPSPPLTAAQLQQLSDLLKSAQAKAEYRAWFDSLNPIEKAGVEALTVGASLTSVVWGLPVEVGLLATKFISPETYNSIVISLERHLGVG